MKLKISYLILFTLIVNIFSANATIRYVSKTGTSTPPYTSWATASDSIQKCINICVTGDTVYVANGVYYESIYIDKTINLWGSSMDSTVIDGTNISGYNIVYFFENNSSFKNFKITSSNQQRLGLGARSSNLIAEFCKIINISNPIGINYSSVYLSNFIVQVFEWGIFDECPNDTCHSVYSNNIIFGTNPLETPVIFSFGGKPTFNNNIVIDKDGTYNIRGIDIEHNKGAIVKNNLVSGYKDVNIGARQIYTDTAYFENNNSFNSEVAFLSSAPGRTIIRNNIAKDVSSGIQSSFGIVTDYNLFWNVQELITGTGILGDSNIVAYPMFVKDTIPNPELNFDYHLQAYSPAIDKGNPNILDVDGSRSDIGMFGGPNGEYYKYIDLPPKTPRNFRDSLDLTNILFLNWDRNSESDFRNYNIYRDTIAGFIPDEINLIAQTDTSYFTDNLSSIIAENIYYRITAVDKQDNESEPGNEIAVLIVGVNTEVQIVRDYFLYQNYPNPFNPSTTISYEIKENSYVKVMVYDIKGELIEVLVNKEQEAGYYEVDFTVNSPQSSVGNSIASGIYLYRIEVIGKGNNPVYSDMKKMILIK